MSLPGFGLALVIHCRARGREHKRETLTRVQVDYFDSVLAQCKHLKLPSSF